MKTFCGFCALLVALVAMSLGLTSTAQAERVWECATYEINRVTVVDENGQSQTKWVGNEVVDKVTYTDFEKARAYMAERDGSGCITVNR